MLARHLEQLILGGRPRLLDRAQNPSARGGDLLVTFARDTLLELRRAVAGKDQVGMRIHKTRRDAAALGIDDRGVRCNARAKFGIGSNSGDAAIFDE